MLWLLFLDNSMRELFRTWIYWFRFLAGFELAWNIQKRVMVLPTCSRYHFETHLTWQTAPIIYIVTCIDPSNHQIRTNINPSQHMSPFILLHSSFTKQSIILQMMDNVNTCNSPNIFITWKWYLQCLHDLLTYISPSHCIFLLHIGKCESYTWLTFFNGDIKMYAKVFLWLRLELYIDLCWRSYVRIFLLGYCFWSLHMDLGLSHCCWKESTQIFWNICEL